MDVKEKHLLKFYLIQEIVWLSVYSSCSLPLLYKKTAPLVPPACKMTRFTPDPKRWTCSPSLLSLLFISLLVCRTQPLDFAGKWILFVSLCWVVEVSSLLFSVPPITSLCPLHLLILVWIVMLITEREREREWEMVISVFISSSDDWALQDSYTKLYGWPLELLLQLIMICNNNSKPYCPSLLHVFAKFFAIITVVILQTSAVPMTLCFSL